MKTLLNLTHKRAGDLLPGELFRLSFSSVSGSSLVLMLGHTRDGDPLYGFISSPDFQTPLTWYEGSSTDRCLSYSIDWLLEERPGPETAPGGKAPATPRTAIHFDNDGTIMRFSPAPSFSNNAINFNLSTGKLVGQGSGYMAPMVNWAIWANLEHYQSPRADALFVYPPA
ncbi:hypothetical protein [Mesorhizobium sp. DCY119]|uniref:hypothetical protein n=1 Tax=Mesorhizobium sp. DCY119 TaxID=2108445 RepID=UPI001058921B|nr:hypothetical protein [Mesorhizobium sp. DCY119]